MSARMINNLQRSLFAGIALSALASLGACERAQPANTRASAQPAVSEHAARSSRVLRVGFTVSDLDRSVRAFERLEFKRVAEREPASESLSALYGLPNAHARVAELALGDETVELTECTTPRGRTIPPDSRSDDPWFQHMAIVVRDMADADERLFGAQAGASPFKRLSPSPQTIPLSNPAAGGIGALYFRDADDHNLELIWFPAGKGRASWQKPSANLFLGVDHSAIAVADGDRGEHLYGALGFAVAGRSLNFGAEQEALSGVRGARVAIVGLRDASGPGVEFLSYLAPTRERRRLADSTPCDLWHWEITIAVARLETALAELEPWGATRVSSSIANFADDALGYRRAVLVRDLDGHALRLVEP